MDMEGVIIGAIFIVLGLLVKEYPNLIAGYNTMSPEKKMNVDEQGLTSWVRNCLIGIGLLLIAGAFVISMIKMEHITTIYFMTVVIGGVVLLIYGAQKFDRN